MRTNETRRVDLSHLAYRGMLAPERAVDEPRQHTPYGSVICDPSSNRAYVLACIAGEPRWLEVVGMRGRPVRPWHWRLRQWLRNWRLRA